MKQRRLIFWPYLRETTSGKDFFKRYNHTSPNIPEIIIIKLITCATLNDPKIKLSVLSVSIKILPKLYTIKYTNDKVPV